MAKRRSSKGAVEWYLPGRKRPFAYSTVATSDLIRLVSESGLSVVESADLILFDQAATAILQHMAANGLANHPLSELVSSYGEP